MEGSCITKCTIIIEALSLHEPVMAMYVLEPTKLHCDNLNYNIHAAFSSGSGHETSLLHDDFYLQIMSEA